MPLCSGNAIGGLREEGLACPQRGKLWAMVHVKLSLIATPPCRDCSVRRGQNLPERARTMHELDRGNKARRTLRARATMFPIR